MTFDTGGRLHAIRTSPSPTARRLHPRRHPFNSRRNLHDHREDRTTHRPRVPTPSTPNRRPRTDARRGIGGRQPSYFPTARIHYQLRCRGGIEPRKRHYRQRPRKTNLRLDSTNNLIEVTEKDRRCVTVKTVVTVTTAGSQLSGKRSRRPRHAYQKGLRFTTDRGRERRAALRVILAFFDAPVNEITNATSTAPPRPDLAGRASHPRPPLATSSGERVTTSPRHPVADVAETRTTVTGFTTTQHIVYDKFRQPLQRTNGRREQPVRHTRDANG